jgi:hypothetical protein
MAQSVVLHRRVILVAIGEQRTSGWLAWATELKRLTRRDVAPLPEIQPHQYANPS